MIYWLSALLSINLVCIGIVYGIFHKKKRLLDIRIVVTLFLTLPPLVSLINGMLVFFMGFSIFSSIVVAGFLGLLIGGLVGGLSNLVTFSFSSIISFYFGLMGPMIATPLISPNLCGIYIVGSTQTFILLLSALGTFLIGMFTLLYINLLKG